MRRNTCILVFGLVFFGSLFYGGQASAACDQTLSVGANVATAVSSAATGSTICLNTGNYGSVNLFNISRSGFVTVQSTTGQGAVISPQVGASSWIKFQNLTLSSVGVNSCSTHIYFLNSTFQPNQSGLLFDASSCPSTTHDYMVDGVVFDQVQQALYEGRLNCRDCNGAVIKNSTFSGEPSSNPADGIQTQGNTQNLTIGPGNHFSGILESLCGATHCDAIQLQGGGKTDIISNWFENGDTFLMSPDGCSNVSLRDNIFNGATSSYPYKLQMGTCANPLVEHNTFYNASIAVDAKTGSGASTNLIFRNNIMSGGNTDIKMSGGGGCTNCVLSYNLFTSGAQGTNAITGTPTYVGGGTNPTTWAGWQLAVGSLGKSNGSDGLDRGTTFYGTAVDTTPPTITQITPVPSVSRDTTPTYTFSSTESGTIQYTGDCTSSTTTATSGNNTITLTTLGRGTHSNCSLRVTDASNNPSTSLSLPSFIISYQSDLNQDRHVDSLDFGILHTNFGTGNVAGDINSDGTVNVLDFGIMHTEYGGVV